MSSTFANVSATEGKRLLAFMHARAPRSAGGLDGLAERSGLRRQTPYEWAAGRSKPNLGTLKPWADALGVTRAEMVAAMDASAAPLVDPDQLLILADVKQRVDQIMTDGDVRAFVGEVEGRLVNAIQAGRQDLLDEVAKRVAEIVAERLGTRSGGGEPDGTQDPHPTSGERPPGRPA